MPSVDLQLLTRRASYYHSDRLALRPFSFADVWPLWEATRNAEFNRQLRWDAPAETEQLGRRMERFLGQFKRGELAALSAVERQTGQWVAMYRFSPWRDGLEMGLWVHPRYWRGGIGVELTRLAVLAAFLEADVSVLYACVQSTNVRAQQVLEKAGLVLRERCVTDHESGAPLDTLVYALTRYAYSELDAARSAREHGAQRFDTLFGRFEVCATTAAQRPQHQATGAGA